MNTNQEYTIDSPSYPAFVIASLADSYGGDNNSRLMRDAEIMASVLTSKDELRAELTGTPEYGTPEYETHRTVARALAQRFYDAGGDNGHSGYSWYTMCRIAWMRITNGELPVGKKPLE